MPVSSCLRTASLISGDVVAERVGEDAGEEVEVGLAVRVGHPPPAARARSRAGRRSTARASSAGRRGGGRSDCPMPSSVADAPPATPWTVCIADRRVAVQCACMYPTVADVLTLPVIRQGMATVVAGADGLDRRVRWVHIAEIADIAPLLARRRAGADHRHRAAGRPGGADQVRRRAGRGRRGRRGRRAGPALAPRAAGRAGRRPPTRTSCR